MNCFPEKRCGEAAGQPTSAHRSPLPPRAAHTQQTREVQKPEAPSGGQPPLSPACLANTTIFRACQAARKPGKFHVPGTRLFAKPVKSGTKIHLLVPLVTRTWRGCTQPPADSLKEDGWALRLPPAPPSCRLGWPESGGEVPGVGPLPLQLNMS